MGQGSNHWRVHLCIKKAKECATRAEFWKSREGEIARSNGWIDVIKSYLPKKYPPNYWTLERCIEAAEQCENRSALERGAKASIKRNGWESAMEAYLPKSMTGERWTLERCIEAVTGCNSRSELKKLGVMNFIKRHGLMSEIAPYLPKSRGSSYLRCIYVITNDVLNLSYVGLSYDYKKRVAAHRRGDYKQTKDLGKHPATKFEQLTGYLPEEEAQHLEGVYGKEYEQKYRLLNHEWAYGALGGCGVRISIKAIKAAALQCKMTTEFKKRFPSEYSAAQRRGIMGDVCAHMIDGRTIRPCKYTDNELVIAALLFEARADFEKDRRASYALLCQRGLQSRIEKYIPRLRAAPSQGVYHTPHGKFTSLARAGERCGVNRTTVKRRCQDADNRIIKTGRTLPKEWVGKTWRELGWWFETK